MKSRIFLSNDRCFPILCKIRFCCNPLFYLSRQNHLSKRAARVWQIFFPIWCKVQFAMILLNLFCKGTIHSRRRQFFLQFLNPTPSVDSFYYHLSANSANFDPSLPKKRHSKWMVPKANSLFTLLKNNTCRTCHIHALIHKAM